MASFRPMHLTIHDIGVVYNDNREPDGTALFCFTRKTNTDSVAVNIEDFNSARLLGITSVIFRIVAMNWIKRISMQKATELMEHARHFEDTNYKLISKLDVEGEIEIPEDKEVKF